MRWRAATATSEEIYGTFWPAGSMSGVNFHISLVGGVSTGSVRVQTTTYDSGIQFANVSIGCG